ncbi:MAG: NPCBM/NEW2 domain-containing protein, partial [Planctomycetota bacterium]|nr:NPCBM/NEW2 domain-containing protein [Planctomycetota bacterium]
MSLSLLAALLLSAVVLAMATSVSAGAAESPGEPDTVRWAATVFGDTPAGGAPRSAPTRPALALRRQDHGQLGRNQSCIGTTLRIGKQDFKRGLGSHANSELAVSFDPGSVKSFKAFAGVDNNHDTRGEFGTVEFSIGLAGKEVWRSKVLRSGDDPLPVSIDVPATAGELVLKADATADGPAHDHADWADAQLVMNDGRAIWLDELVPVPKAGDLWPSDKPPFLFSYDGKSSSEFLASWPRKTQSKDVADRVEHVTQWTDPKTGLEVTATATAFKDFPAVEWVLRFKNTGAQDTAILSQVAALDMLLGTAKDQSLVLDQIAGDDCSERSFVPGERELKPGQNVALAPVGGRPSNGTFPFLNLQCGPGGFFVAIGWTGQWSARVNRDAAGPTRLQAGMELTHLLLHPGEAIRAPRIMLLRWSGDRIDAHNLFRRLLLAHYLPKLDGKPIDLAITAQTFNRWASGARPTWGTEEGQIAAAKTARDLGCDTHWFDAGWFEGNFPNGVGNWFPKPKEFPRGLAPVGQACEELGLKFLVWYEPERVGNGTQIAREHPEFVLPAKKPAGQGGLFNLGDPKARRWMTDLLIKQIAEFHIHTYRNDFNMDPLPFWRGNDPPDRQGITEIRYVEGFYEMWDAMRVAYPRMYLDDCASGGRRIDLEMVMRSVVQTRSDTACAPGRAEWDQSQTYGLSLYLPLHATIGWDTATYDCRSIGAAGFCAEWDLLDKAFPMDQARACIAEIKENRKYWSGDYYPLTPWSMAHDHWIAWQFHRPDLDAGIVLAFRRKDSPYPALQAALRGVKPDQTY